ncbi:NUDIX domain-containing protein [Amycolatopsis sp. lyj-23]|uniref:NUDIX domain-containing protein n=1 Tax=Amycolatopsis sp. lyj-23 TaxID=2789283 RepID=UPI00397E89B6
MIIGVGVVVARDGRPLLVCRNKAGESPTRALRGGAVKSRESIERATMRELPEETGFRAVSRRVSRSGQLGFPTGL